ICLCCLFGVGSCRGTASLPMSDHRVGEEAELHEIQTKVGEHRRLEASKTVSKSIAKSSDPRKCDQLNTPLEMRQPKQYCRHKEPHPLRIWPLLQGTNDPALDITPK